MHVIRARNINAAWPQALDLVESVGLRQETRNGPALVVPEPVVTVYDHPEECVLLDVVRDVNPFLSVFESLFLLAGRDDARWLDQFVKDFSARFAEPDGRLHGSYGARWRRTMGLVYACEATELEAGGGIASDQLTEVVAQIRANPQTRQAVIQMWRAETDLTMTQPWRDRPCNLLIMLRVDRGVLDMTVTCRSNDVVFGWGGSNPPQFSLLHQYLAARIDIPIGRYTVLSNNFHRYENTVHKCRLASARRNAAEPYPGTAKLVDTPDAFDDELYTFLDNPVAEIVNYTNTFFPNTAQPLFLANLYRNDGQYDKALSWASRAHAPDWRAAAVEWLQRRVDRRAEKENDDGA